MLSCRVDKSEHTLLRATADVIDRFPGDTTFQATEVFISTWHRITKFPGDPAKVLHVGHEPAGLTVHPPPKKSERWSIFFALVSSATKFFSSNKKWILQAILKVKAQKTCFFFVILLHVKRDFHQHNTVVNFSYTI